MRILWPAALLLLAAPPAIWWWARRSRPPALRFSHAAPLARIRPSLRVRLAFLPAALSLLALALAIVAVARPQQGLARETRRAEGVDIVLALDVSSSMNARDFAPATRLLAAKEVLEDFVNRRANDRLGAVAFARHAVTITPLTLDHAVLVDQLRSVEIGDLPDGTAIGNAIAASVNRLADSPSESRVLVLLTDGVTNAGEIHPLTAAALARSKGVRIYAVGAGSPEGTTMVVPRPGGGQRSVVPGIDEETLREIASSTGGRYFQARDSDGLRAVYEEIDALERVEVVEASWASWAETGPTLAAWAAAALLLGLVLDSTGLRRFP